jgi:hypothetical protein
MPDETECHVSLHGAVVRSQKLDRAICFERCRSWRQVSEEYRPEAHPASKTARSPTATGTSRPATILRR